MSAAAECQILRAVRLFAPISELRRTADRVMLSAGSMPASLLSPPNNSYIDGARVPKPEWRAPTKDEGVVLWATEQSPIHEMVGIVRVFDADVLGNLQATINSLWLMPTSDSRVWTHPLTSTLMSRFKTMCIVEGSLDFHGVTFDPPGLHTVSIDPRVDKLVGLHVDYWERKNISERHTCRTRMCVNIGREDRHFLYINLSVVQMREMLKSKGQVLTTPEEAGLIGQSFLAAFPEYPVVKLLISPGEAYIAPTENILHDASSISAKTHTLHTAFRGQFRFLPTVDTSDPRSGADCTDITNSLG